MDQLKWFKFSPANWSMGRISKMPYNVQGAYVRLCCIYWNKECKLTQDDAQLELLDIPEAYETLLQYGIIKGSDPDSICIDFLDEQYRAIMGRKEILSEAGKRGAKVKATKQVTKGQVKGTHKPQKADKDIDKENIYISIEHLHLTHEEYNKLCEVWHEAHVNNVLDAIGNYQGIAKYKSLYLTCRQWLKDKPKKDDQVGIKDEYVDYIMKQLGK